MFGDSHVRNWRGRRGNTGKNGRPDRLGRTRQDPRRRKPRAASRERAWRCSHHTFFAILNHNFEGNGWYSQRAQSPNELSQFESFPGPRTLAGSGTPAVEEGVRLSSISSRGGSGRRREAKNELRRRSCRPLVIFCPLHRRCITAGVRPARLGLIVADMPHASAKIASVETKARCATKKNAKRGDPWNVLVRGCACKRDVMDYDADSISNAERAALRRLRDLVNRARHSRLSGAQAPNDSVLGTLMSMAIKHVK